MDTQKAYSLAVQALYDRRDALFQKYGECHATRECESAIQIIENHKGIDQFLNGFSQCEVKIEMHRPCDQT